jgi:hypothetical protein
MGTPPTKEYLAKYFQDNKVRLMRKNAKWAKDNPERAKFLQTKSRLWNFYRLTPEEWDKINEYQKGVCAITGKPPKNQALSTDHNHHTGEVRGLLSIWINRGLACFNDDPILLRAAADYLENPPARAALGKSVFGIIGRSEQKKKMIYGGPNGERFDKEGNPLKKKADK